MTPEWFPRTAAMSVAALLVLSALVTSACPDSGAAGGLDPTRDSTPVAVVRIEPGELSLPAGALDVTQATILDGAGTLLTDRSILWTTDDPGIATVDAAGIITGVSPGTAVISALCGGVTGTVQVTVTERVERPWPNEPVSFKTEEDQAWSTLDAVKWNLQWGTATIVPDLTAPFSAPLTLQVTYPTGFHGGYAPGTLEIALGRKRGVYTGIWWKVSDPWEGHPSNVNKIQFLFGANGGPTYMAMYGAPGGPYDLRILPSFPGLPSEWYKPNVKDIPVSLGVWHRIEWLVVYNTTTDPPNGVYRWWLNGELVGDHTDVEFPEFALQYYKVSPTWGGMGARKTQTDFYRYDHIHISGR